jgi:hypothetical protein
MKPAIKEEALPKYIAMMHFLNSHQKTLFLKIFTETPVNLP